MGLSVSLDVGFAVLFWNIIKHKLNYIINSAQKKQRGVAVEYDTSASGLCHWWFIAQKRNVCQGSGLPFTVYCSSSSVAKI